MPTTRVLIYLNELGLAVLAAAVTTSSYTLLVLAFGMLVVATAGVHVHDLDESTTPDNPPTRGP